MTASENRLGRVELGGFRLQRVIGEGAFGAAFLADQLGTDRKAVVKIAHAHLLAGPSRKHVEERYEAEVRTISRVQHPSLATFYTAGMTTDGLPALAIEFVGGAPLGHLLDEGATRAEIQSIFEQVGDGVRALHEGGIVHRDLSPQNVMVERVGGAVRAKIIDFGIAKITGRGASGQYPVGTPRYIAPEQIRGLGEPASDMYSIGSLLFFALSGREYLERFAHVAEVLVHVNGEPEAESPGALNAAITPEEDRLVRDLLSPTPSKRPTAAQFLERWRSIGRLLGRRRVLVVDDGDAVGPAVVAHLEALGDVVEWTHEPKRASRAEPGEFALIVLSAHMRSVDPVRLTQHLEEHLPAQELWVAGLEFGLGWQKVSRARCIRVPEDLSIATPPPSSIRRTPPVSLPTGIEDFIGGGAEVLAAMQEAGAAKDWEALARATRRMLRLATGAEASEVMSLSRVLIALIEDGASSNLGGFVREVGNAYRVAARGFLVG